MSCTSPSLEGPAKTLSKSQLEMESAWNLGNKLHAGSLIFAIYPQTALPRFSVYNHMSRGFLTLCAMEEL